MSYSMTIKLFYHLEIHSSSYNYTTYTKRRILYVHVYDIDAVIYLQIYFKACVIL